MNCGFAYFTKGIAKTGARGRCQYVSQHTTTQMGIEKSTSLVEDDQIGLSRHCEFCEAFSRWLRENYWRKCFSCFFADKVLHAVLKCPIAVYFLACLTRTEGKTTWSSAPCSSARCLA
jgi:hypothetical protein